MHVNLANISTASEQDIFDQVVAHARQQKCRSMNALGTCMYRNDAGLKCFAGALMDDSEYKPRFENKTFIGVAALVEKNIEEAWVDFVRMLQMLHDDDSLVVEDWEENFRCIAKNRGLQYTPPQS